MKEIARRLVAARIESAGVEIRRMIDVDRLVAEIEAALTDAAATARADGERDMRERAAKASLAFGKRNGSLDARRFSHDIAAAIRLLKDGT